MPRFVAISRGVSGFQHPHYFFNQSDKLASLLDRISMGNIAYGAGQEYIQAGHILTTLLEESRLYGGLTREQLREYELNVRTFIDKVQAVDCLAAEWEERQKQAQAPVKRAAKRRGRDDECDEETSVCMKRRRESCGGELMDMDVGMSGSCGMQTAPTQQQPVYWTQPYFS